MKKIMLKLLLITMLFVTMIGAVSAEQLFVSLNTQSILNNQSSLSVSSVTPNFNVSGNSTTWTCNLYHNITGAFGNKQTLTNVVNNSITNFTAISNMADNSSFYAWNVFCNSTLAPQGNWSKEG